MSKYSLLSQSEHAKLRVITERSADYGDNLMYAMTFPLEFRNIESCYPIFFAKDGESGQFYPLALFGFQRDENLYLKGNVWDATYMPLMVERNPFLIGFQQSPDVENGEKRPVVSINIESPRITEIETEVKSEALFTDSGEPSEYLQKSMENLQTIHRGHDQNKQFIATLLEHDLLEGFNLDITLKDGSNNRLEGFYTINEEKLAGLQSETLGKLHEQGFLQAIYMVVASFSQVSGLIAKKNASLD
ncbi:MAG: SapC family protein [Porticoccaceae bacterium]|nr:SapC family protein [Porticoccaceae bacterium]